jgi:hypothetical protein
MSQKKFTMTSDLAENVSEWGRCLVCGEKLTDSALSICFDPQWKHNVWGGDTHETISYLHETCIEKLIAKVCSDL